MILDKENAKVTKEIYKALKNLYIEEALKQFAKDSKIHAQELQNVETNKPIPSEIGKKLRNLLIIKSGTTYFPAPKPVLDPIKSNLIDEAQSFLIDLLRNIPIKELARKLKIEPVQIQNYLENREPISLIIANKLRFLWQIEFGTSYFPGPRSVLDEPIECSIFDLVYKFVGDNKKYKISNVKDVLTKKIEGVQYDDALKRIMPQINEILYIFFKKKLEIEETQELSSGITAVCPEYRKFEIEIIDNDVMQYYFIYGKGRIIDCSESLHYEKIVAVLKNEGSWES